MKKICLLALLLTQTAAATPWSKKIYLRADGGLGFPVENSGVKFRNSPMYGAGGGFKFNEMFRADLNVQGRSIQGKVLTVTGKAQNEAAFLNLYLNLTDFEEMTPYVNIGIGYSRNKSSSNETIKANLKTFATGDTSSNLAWNLGAGTTVKIHNNVSLDAGYKYINLGNIKFKDSGLINVNTGQRFPIPGSGPFQIKNIRTHEVFAGIIINF